MEKIKSSLLKLKSYVENENFSGFDLYDGLKFTKSKFILNNYLLNTFFTQFFKLTPINIRKLIGIKKTEMPKAIGIFLNAYTELTNTKLPNNKSNYFINYFIDFLSENFVKGYSGYCWNFGFNYKFMFDKPTVVITSIIAKGLYSHLEISKDKKSKDLLIGIKDFILKDLIISDFKNGICFSYTPAKKDLCFNASLLGAETLARISKVSGDSNLNGYIEQAVNFVLSHQKEDGRWNYSIDPETGLQREQVDFHQGYILESLYEIKGLMDWKNDGLEDSIKRGMEFYRREQFFDSGQSKWRIPKVWPVDIHNQAQGIITFSRLSEYNPEYIDFAKKIAEWTIDNMQDKKGYFYFRKGRFITNKISYMRWSNAWMLLALTELQLKLKEII